MARVRILANGRAVAQSGTQDLGTGTYTVMAQVASDTLGLPPDRITFELGDTTLPFALTSVSSSTARSVGPAVRAAAEAAKRKALKLAVRDRKSPLYGAKPEAVGAAESELFLKADPSRRDTYAAILSRRRMDKVEARRITGLPEALHGIAPAMLPSVPGGLLRAATSPFAGKHSTYDFGAQYVEVKVDPDLGIVRLSRALGVFDIGTVLNPKTARSQAIGGITWGLGMALLEQSPVHAMLGKFVSPNLSGYLVPTNADVPAIDALFVGKPDPHANPLGVKGVGELPIVGVAAAIANAVYHATGKRIRDLPITPEKLL
jgi:xanthine dehydrogenase YagR molybdenum-binding subunit